MASEREIAAAAADDDDADLMGSDDEMCQEEEADDGRGALERSTPDGETVKKTPSGKEKSGVAYLGHIPPALRPNKLRTMLEEFGELGRIYLAPREQGGSGAGAGPASDAGGAASRDARRRHARHYHEGWVEFRSRAACKRACALLNGTPMAGRRKSKHYHDLWCIRYVRGLTWDMINEERTEKRVQREHRIREELATARRDRDFYVSRVDQAKAIAAMEKRKRGGGDGGGDASAVFRGDSDGDVRVADAHAAISEGKVADSEKVVERVMSATAQTTTAFQKRTFKQRRAGASSSKKLSGGLISALFGASAD